MPRITQAAPAAREHREAVTLVTEMSGCLGLSIDYVRDLTGKVTARPWERGDNHRLTSVWNADSVWRFTLQLKTV